MYVVYDFHILQENFPHAVVQSGRNLVTTAQAILKRQSPPLALVPLPAGLVRGLRRRREVTKSFRHGSLTDLKNAGVPKAVRLTAADGRAPACRRGGFDERKVSRAFTCAMGVFSIFFRMKNGNAPPVAGSGGRDGDGTCLGCPFSIHLKVFIREVLVRKES